MELRVLKYFLTVAEKESITKAAESLYITQPTLSRQLMDLEEEVGKKLFIRGKKIILTEEGLLLRKRAEEIFSLVDKTTMEISNSDDIINGDIHIGTGDSNLISPILRKAKKLQDDYPNIKYHFYSGNLDFIMEKLDNGLIDFGVIFGDLNKEKYNFIEFDEKETLGIITSKNSNLAKVEQISLKHLNDEPIIISSQVITNSFFIKLFEDNKISPKITSTYNLLYTAAILAKEKLGISLGFNPFFDKTEDELLIFKPLNPKVEIQMYLIWKKEQIFSRASQKFLDAMKKNY